MNNFEEELKRTQEIVEELKQKTAEKEENEKVLKEGLELAM